METRRPLDGIRVLELAQVVAGPFCGTLMAEFGAEVIKTEMPGKGDDLRRLGPSEDGASYWFAVDNRNKKLMTLDLRTSKGQEIVRRLVPKVDVVLENFRPGVLEKWGLGWDALHALNPRLIMARITAFGQTGPLRQGPGYAAIGSAFGGTWYVSGHADRPPARPTPVYPDYLTGLFTAFGVMAALRHRDATGEGQWIDAALYESAFRIMEYTTTFYGRQGVVRERGGLQHAGWPGGAFETLDHRWIVFTAPAQHLFERLCVMLGQPDLPNAPRCAPRARSDRAPAHARGLRPLGGDLRRRGQPARPARGRAPRSAARRRPRPGRRRSRLRHGPSYAPPRRGGRARDRRGFQRGHGREGARQARLGARPVRGARSHAAAAVRGSRLRSRPELPGARPPRRRRDLLRGVPARVSRRRVRARLVVSSCNDAARDPGPLHRSGDGARSPSRQHREPVVGLRDGGRPERAGPRAHERARGRRCPGRPLAESREIPRLATTAAHAAAALSWEPWNKEDEHDPHRDPGPRRRARHRLCRQSSLLAPGRPRPVRLRARQRRLCRRRPAGATRRGHAEGLSRLHARHRLAARGGGHADTGSVPRARERRGDAGPAVAHQRAERGRRGGPLPAGQQLEPASTQGADRTTSA